MFEKINIKLFANQPVAKPTSEQIDRIIKSQFQDQYAEVIVKLDSIQMSDPNIKNRINAAILKLAEGEYEKLDKLINTANIDFRDVIAPAEYPRNWKHGFDEITNRIRKKEYLEDWNEYCTWLNSFK